MAGYSGTPLVKKLGIKEGCRICLVGAPSDYRDLVGPLPKGVRSTLRITSKTDIVHIFSTKKTQLARAIKSSVKSLKPDGAIWVSWPKKSSKESTDITEDTVRELALPVGLVDIKVCAVDEVWSGLKLVFRRENRKPTGVASR